MAKQKYCKIGINLTVGNRKAALVEPIEVEDETDVNGFDGELNVLVGLFADAVKALPSLDAYTMNDVKDAVIKYFDIQVGTVNE